MTKKRSQLPMKLIRQLLLLLSLFVHFFDTAEFRPFAYMCHRTAELHVIWTPPAADRGNFSGARLCLYNQNQDSQPIVLTNATKSEVRVPDRRLHLVYGLPSDDMTCRYYYKWKIEPVSSVAPTSWASSGCSSATPFERCEIEVGRSKLCPNSPSSYNVPLQCLVFPKNFTFLRDLCATIPTATEITRVTVIVTSTVLPAAAAAGVAVLLLLLWQKSRSRRDGTMPGDEEGRPPPQPPAKSIFRLLGDRYQVRMFVEHRSSHRMRQCGGHAYMCLNPDTQACIELVPVPEAVPEPVPAA